MNMLFFLFSRFRQSPIFCVLITAMLAWTSVSICGCGNRSLSIQEVAGQGDVDAVRSMLNRDPNLVFNKDTNGVTPLYSATRNDRLEVVKLLLASKADVNASNAIGNTPLELAANNGCQDVAELLLANGADVNAKNEAGDTALHYAAYNGHKNLVELLLAHQAEVNVIDSQGRTPLKLALETDRKGVADLLRQHGGHE